MVCDTGAWFWYGSTLYYLFEYSHETGGIVSLPASAGRLVSLWKLFLISVGFLFVFHESVGVRTYGKYLSPVVFISLILGTGVISLV